jgi:hypothetical protein
MAGVAVINASQPYCRTGFMYASYVAFSTDLELLHLVPASLLKTLSFNLVFQLSSPRGFSMPIFLLNTFLNIMHRVSTLYNRSVIDF